MFGLYPPLHPFAEHTIPVSSLHQLYVEESGNPDGIPVLFLHGGPGAFSHPHNRRFFDPKKYRIILYDQRGCGRSTPHASLVDNDTHALLQDMEQVRQTLHIERWMLFGGSWGATLALLYAIEHPKRVMGMVLRSVFLADKLDLDWLYASDGGAAQFFPDCYGQLLAPVGVKKPVSVPTLMKAYQTKLNSGNELERLAAAKAWCLWEGRVASMKLGSEVDEAFGDPHLVLSMARLECHYFSNHCFIPEQHILNCVQRLAEIPGIVIHGRCDMVCRVAAAAELCERWPYSQLQIVPMAGHADADPGMIDALRKACDTMLEILS